MFWEFIEERIKKFKDSKISDDQIELTYEELLGKVNYIHKMFKEIDIEQRKCAILCEKSLNTSIYMLGCWRMKAIPIPLSINYGASHCNKIIEVMKPDFILTDNCNLDILADKDIPVLSIESEKIADNSQKSQDKEEALKDVALIMCTSGTTGNPKGAMITKKGLMTNVMDIGEYFKISPQDKILIARPLYHCAVLTGEFLISLYKGVNIHFFDQAYNPMVIMSIVGDKNISTLCGTPTLFNHLATYIKRFRKEVNLKNVAISGECLTKETGINIRLAFPNTNIYNVYGLTEASPRVSCLDPTLFDTYPESVGLPLKSVRVKIVDEDNNELPNNVDGQLLIFGANVMKGYYRNQSLTEKVFKNGWLCSGDVAYKDENGYIYIRSRVDDMIIKAGMNIYPKEIENIVITSHIVKEVVVYAIKSDIGHKIGMNVVLFEDYKEYSIKELMKICADLLPSYQLPDEINIVEKLARNASGKVIRPR